MSVEKSQSVDSDQDVGFPTEELIAAREREGLTQKDVARELRLSEKYIDAIERAAFEELPSMVFARGYIRSYTKMVKLDMDHYLALFDELYNGKAPNRSGMRSASGIEPQAKLGDPVIKWSAWLFVLVLIAASFWWWKTQQGEIQQNSVLSGVQPVEVESVDGSTVIVEPRPVIQLDPVSANSEAEAQQQQATEEPVGVAQAAVTDVVEQVDETEAVTEEVAVAVGQAASEIVVEAPEVEAGTGQTVAGSVGSLRVTFVDECWVSVEDQAGEVLAMRVKPAGSELNVSGATPLKVLLGKAAAVDEVFFNGKPVDIDRASRSGVVRLSLPASE